MTIKPLLYSLIICCSLNILIHITAGGKKKYLDHSTELGLNLSLSIHKNGHVSCFSSVKYETHLPSKLHCCLCSKCKRRVSINICYCFNQSSDSFVFPAPSLSDFTFSLVLGDPYTLQWATRKKGKPISDRDAFQGVAENKGRFRDQINLFNLEIQL